MSSLAASEFRELSRLASNDPEETMAACLANPEHVVHWIDQMITELYSYRNKIQDSSEELLQTLIGAWEARTKWEHGIVEEPKGPDMPTIGETVGAMFVGQRLAQRNRDLGKNEKKAPWKFDRRKP